MVLARSTVAWTFFSAPLVSAVCGVRSWGEEGEDGSAFASAGFAASGFGETSAGGSALASGFGGVGRGGRDVPEFGGGAGKSFTGSGSGSGVGSMIRGGGG